MTPEINIAWYVHYTWRTNSIFFKEIIHAFPRPSPQLVRLDSRILSFSLSLRDNWSSGLFVYFRKMRVGGIRGSSQDVLRSYFLCNQFTGEENLKLALFIPGKFIKILLQLEYVLLGLGSVHSVHFLKSLLFGAFCPPTYHRRISIDSSRVKKKIKLLLPWSVTSS